MTQFPVDLFVHGHLIPFSARHEKKERKWKEDRKKKKLMMKSPISPRGAWPMWVWTDIRYPLTRVSTRTSFLVAILVLEVKDVWQLFTHFWTKDEGEDFAEFLWTRVEKLRVFRGIVWIFLKKPLKILVIISRMRVRNSSKLIFFKDEDSLKPFCFCGRGFLEYLPLFGIPSTHHLSSVTDYYY